MTTTPTLVILADDLTGAADTGAPFAAYGFRTTIALTENTPPAEVIVRSTHTRDAPASTVEPITQHTVEALQLQPSTRVYRKIDSAMRGHPALELHATMQALGAEKTLVAPALPDEGRTTVNGQQRVHGVPLENSTVATDGVHSDLARTFARTGTVITHIPLAIVRQGHAAITQAIAEAPPGILIADAETNPDLAHLARAYLASNLRLAAGAAGFGRALAATLSPTRTNLDPSASSSCHSERSAAESRNPPGEARNLDGNLPILIVAGSRNPATAAQIAHLRQQQVPVVALTQHHLDDPTAPAHAIVAEVVHHLEAGSPVALTTADLGLSPHGPAFVADRLISIVSAITEELLPAGLVLTGGDIAHGVLTQLQATALHLRGEIRPALPWGYAELPAGTRIPVATKAGSFGTEDALLACLTHLTRS